MDSLTANASMRRAALHLLRVTRLDNRLLEERELSLAEMRSLACESVGIFAGGYSVIESMDRKLLMLSNSSAANRWVVAVSTKDLLSSTKQRLRDYDYSLPIAEDQSQNGFEVGNLRLTTVEQLCKNSVEILDGVILFDPACHVHLARRFTRFDGSNHDRPQLIANYLSSRRSRGEATLFCLMTLKAPRVVGTARIAEAYMQNGWWFVDPYSLRFTDA